MAILLFCPPFLRVARHIRLEQTGGEHDVALLDTSPLAAPGVAEGREYMARGILNDQEIGVASNIASITFGG